MSSSQIEENVPTNNCHCKVTAIAYSHVPGLCWSCLEHHRQTLISRPAAAVCDNESFSSSAAGVSSTRVIPTVTRCTALSQKSILMPLILSV